MQSQLPRKFIREVPSAKTHKCFYSAFKDWLEKEYPAEVNWEELMGEDDAYPYQGFSDTPNVMNDYSDRDVMGLQVEEELVPYKVYSPHSQQ